jgi:putative CocE/NonD family hydrolase
MSRNPSEPGEVAGVGDSVSRRSILKGASAAAVGSMTLAAADSVAAEPVREDVAVEMSDGVTIRGQLRFPGDSDGGKADGQFPTVATFEPSKNGSDNVSGPSMPRGTQQLVSEGYIRAEFEIRGTGRSEGRFRIGDDQERLDFGELVYWLHDHEKTTGDVGLYGVSYKGLTQWMAATGIARVDRPEQPLQALFPIVTGIDGYRDVLWNGGMYDTVFASFWLGLVAGSPLAASALAVNDVQDPASGSTSTRTTSRAPSRDPCRPSSAPIWAANRRTGTRRGRANRTSRTSSPRTSRRSRSRAGTTSSSPGIRSYTPSSRTSGRTATSSARWPRTRT